MTLESSLRELERLWAEHGVPVAANLAPGRRADEVSRVLGGLGLSASEELITWFTWHDGRAVNVADIGPVLVLLSLDEAVSRRQDELDLAEELADDIDGPYEPPERWDPAWLPLTNFVHGGSFAATCDQPDALSSAVWRYEHEIPPGTPVAASISGMVDGWCELLAGGYWRWDSVNSTWDTSTPDPPSHLRPFTA